MAVVPDPNATLLQPNVDRILPRMLCERFPHLAGSETWIVELLDERGDVVPFEAEDGHDCPPQREVLDALGSPEGANLRPRDPPDLLRVGTEERVVKTTSEPRRDPVLEGVSLIVPMAR